MWILDARDKDYIFSAHEELLRSSCCITMYEEHVCQLKGWVSIRNISDRFCYHTYMIWQKKREKGRLLAYRLPTKSLKWTNVTNQQKYDCHKSSDKAMLLMALEGEFPFTYNIQQNSKLKSPSFFKGII